MDGQLTPTADPHVWIEEQRRGYTRYRNDEGCRWEVRGVCDHRRFCMVGAVVNGRVVRTVEEARALPAPELDTPVAPGFSGCCPLVITVLDGD